MPEKPFFVINADVLTNADFVELLNFHIEKGSIATMCVRKFEQQVPYGVIKSDESASIRSIHEKPSFSFDVNAGIYMLNPEVITNIPKNEYLDMTELFEILMSCNNCFSFNLSDYWLDIGQEDDYRKANIDMEYYQLIKS